MREGAVFKTTAGAKGLVGSRAWAAGDTGGYSFGEEVANAVTHGLAAALSIVGLVVLVMSSLWHDRSTVVVASAAVFGASMIVLYLISTLYHALPQPGAKRVLRVLDHSAIYLLIAGTYTPFCLVTLGGTRERFSARLSGRSDSPALSFSRSLFVLPTGSTAFFILRSAGA